MRKGGCGNWKINLGGLAWKMSTAERIGPAGTAKRMQRGITERGILKSTILSPLLEGAPLIRTFNVHTSTTHKIAAGKAA